MSAFDPLQTLARAAKIAQMWMKRRKAKIEPETGEIAEAARNPGGWVYSISGAYGPNDRVPPEAIVGAWKVGDDGVIAGDFMPNPNFKGGNS